MHELRLVAVSEDGTYVVLAQPGRAGRFTLPNDERLRAVVRGQFSRLAQYEIEVESPLRPKEIQARIRSGETAEQIADAAGVPIERVRWFEGPVLAERAYIAQQAQAASVRRPGDPGPGPRLGEIVAERLHDLGADPEEAQWDSRKRGDGSWLVELTSEAGPERLTAVWVFDPRRRHAIPDDDDAARLSLPEDALQAAGLAAQQATADHGGRGRGTVTPFVPRSHSAARTGAGPDLVPAAQRAPQPMPGPAERQPLAQPARAAGVDHGAGPDHAAGRDQASGDIAAEPVERRRYSAAAPEPQTSPSAMPRLQPPERATGGEQMPGPAAPQAPGPGPGRPAAPAAGMRRGSAPQQAPAAAGPAAAGEVPAAAEAPQEQPARGRAARKAAGGRGRRSSVPTWDEIMLGSSRRQD